MNITEKLWLTLTNTLDVGALRNSFWLAGKENSIVFGWKEKKAVVWLEGKENSCLVGNTSGRYR